MRSETETLSHPSNGRLILYFLFAWAIFGVCGASTIIATGLFFGFEHFEEFSISSALFLLVLAILRYGSGAFVLGTLTRTHIKAWTAAIIYIIPASLIPASTFIGAALSDTIKEDILSNPWLRIGMPIIYLLIGPFVSVFFIRVGEVFSKAFSRPKAILNIPWQHWLWILPFSLFQVIGVPLFVLFNIWETRDSGPVFSILFLSFAPIISYIIIWILFIFILMAIVASYVALSEDSGSGWVRTLKVLGTWLLLTGLQAFIILGTLGQHVAEME
jgi:hypothetical protein